MSCGVGPRSSSDPALLWLWWRPVATALMRPLAWESPYAAEAAPEKAKRPKKKKKKIGNNHLCNIYSSWMYAQSTDQQFYFWVYNQKERHTRTIITTLFKWPSGEVWVNKVWCIHIKAYSTARKNKRYLTTQNNMGESQKQKTQQKKPQKSIQRAYSAWFYL